MATVRKYINPRRIGFLVQNYALFPHMSVAQNIAFGPKGLSALNKLFHISIA
ncbi:hypothetical protein [Nostoc sp.]|uniref:hypothetical protein n=1 Tax=Nostoc sp. TaxID=1180 RepID=UPI002FF66AA6